MRLFARRVTSALCALAMLAVMSPFAAWAEDSTTESISTSTEIVETSDENAAVTSQQGDAENTQQGDTEGTQQGDTEGTQQGDAEGTQQGDTEGTQQGDAEGTRQGDAEGTQQGSTEETNTEIPSSNDPSGSVVLGANVAKIGDTEYATLDEAVTAAQDGETIELLADATTAGLNLSKSLTIRAAAGLENKPTITFTTYGIALWGKSLSFEGLNIVMNGIGSTPYTGEWSWMSICANSNASLVLNDTTMTMDATGATGSPHAIYFCSNNKLNLENGSVLTIKNYPNDALEWDGGDGGYNVNITDSTFISDHNRSGFTGTFYATITNSNVEVINSTGNGSNGSNYIIKDNSKVDFSHNGSHGLSAGNLTIQDSTVTCLDNGMTGIIFTGTGNFINSDITITGTKGTSYWNAGLRLYKENAKLTVDKDTKMVIQNNYVTGIFMDSSSRMTIEDGANVLVTNNEAKQEYCSTSKDLAKQGGGLTIRSNASAVLSASTQIYNNHAALSGDDIYLEDSDASLEFHPVGTDWVLDDCDHAIDGWYDDSEDARWNTHDKTAYHADLFKDFNKGVANVTGPLSLKAAHAETATLQPADITIYMGGTDGYEGVADDSGEILSNNSLPEPGYYITLPEEINQALEDLGYTVTTGDGTQPSDLSALITIRTVGADEEHLWTLHKYGNTYSAARGKYIYAVAPKEDSGTDPFRLNFIDEENNIIDQDNFKPSEEETLQARYQMDIYSELVNARQVFLEVKLSDTQTYYCTMNTEPGYLNVRYVTGSQESVVTPTYTDIAQASEEDNPDKTALDKAYVIKAPGTKFYINNSDIDVTEGGEFAQVSLLFDDIVSNTNTDGVEDYKQLLTDKAIQTVAGDLVNVQSQGKYLDLVDANNGNTWLTPSQPVTVYWPYPEGTDASTEFRLVHFEGLDRDMTTDEVTGQIDSTLATTVKLEKDAYGISFTTQTFSPFVLVWGDEPAKEEGGQPTQTPVPTPAPTAAPAVSPTPAPVAAVIPQTGDESQPLVWVTLVVLSGAALAGLAVYRKKHSGK